MENHWAKICFLVNLAFLCNIFQTSAKPVAVKSLVAETNHSPARTLYSHFVRSAPAKISYFGHYPEGTSTCSLDPIPPILSHHKWVLAAVSKEDFLGSLVCGTCVKISTIDLTRKDEPENIYAAIVDSCNACEKGEINLYTEGKGKRRANFIAVDCLGAREEPAPAESLQAVIRQAGSNMKIQIKNTVLPVVGLEMFTQGKWTCLPRDSDDNYYVLGMESLKEAVQLRATSVAGESIGFSLSDIKYNEQLSIHHQFRPFVMATRRGQEPVISCYGQRNVTTGKDFASDGNAKTVARSGTEIAATKDSTRNRQQMDEGRNASTSPKANTNHESHTGISPNISSHTNSSFCKRKSDGTYPHSMDCRQFLLCVEGKTFAKTCPNDLRFNAKEGVCDWPRNINCNGDLPTAETSRESDDEEVYTKKFISSKSLKLDTNSKKSSSLDTIN